ncbi:MAG: DnaJ C-terminal domain-containing protein [Bradymonadaceae bacterium]
MSEADPYTELGVSPGASQDEIKEAYRRLALKYHPDRNPDDEAAAERFKRISRAYQILGDPQSRRRYDRARSAEALDGAIREGWSALSDVVEAFESVVTGSRSGRADAGRDVETTVEVSLEEAFEGTTKRVAVPGFERCSACNGRGAPASADWQPCPDCSAGGLLGVARQLVGDDCSTCGGSGTVPDPPCDECDGTGLKRRARPLELEIPVGASDGSVVRIPGEGAPPRGEGPHGDLLVELDVADHDVLRRDGRDVHCDRAVSFSTAALGGAVEVETLEGPVRVEIPPGTETGAVLRLRGRGFHDRKIGARGDQYVHLEVDARATAAREETDRRTEGASIRDRVIGAVTDALD